ncbi:SpoIIE family protein phosphatase [Streptomyces sp. NPDC021354]|uniref:SpoIIE family protein phosphatase n=1 Tax=Streptomyces sp. NPDC021354 TaxID=3154793 RepID=UPI0034021EF2
MNGPERQHSGVEELFTEGGSLGRLMSGIDWAATPLGRTEAWPARLTEALRIVLDSEQPMALFWGPEFRMLYNEGYTTIIGSKHPEALGRPCVEVFPENWDTTTGPLFHSVVDGRKPILVNDMGFAFIRRGFLEQSYYDISYQPIPMPDGTVGGVLCVVTETTARVLSERRLRLLATLGSRTAGLSSPQDVARTCVEVLDAHREDVPCTAVYLASGPGELWLAAATACGDATRPPGELRLDRTAGETARETAGDGDGLAARLATVVGDAAPAWLPGALLGRPGEEALAHPLVCSGEVAGVLVMGVNPKLPVNASYRDFYDVLSSGVSAALAAAHTQQEQRRRAEALAELDRAKTTFFSNVSHEFRTPLTLLLGPVQQALAEEDRPERRRQLELAERNALRLLKLVNTLLDVSRAEAGRLKGNFEPVDLSHVTADLAAVFRSAFDLAGLSLRVDCPPLPGPVHVDREMWEKIVLNLLSNALKFTFAGGVTVRMAAAGERARLTVTDTGTGVPPEELPYLFDRFHQVRGARSRSHEGSGIGLALVKDLVELHAGTVSVSSRPGEGTTFTVEVPFGTAHLAARGVATAATSAADRGAYGGPVRQKRTAAFAGEALHWLQNDATDVGGLDSMDMPASPPEGDGAHRPLLLVADDNADVRGYLKDLLAPEHDVLLAGDGRAALETALSHPVDLVLTDVMMPRLDGFALVRALRQDPRTTRLPIIVLTARAGEEAMVRGLRAGADDYLAKPFSARQLLARVRANLELSRLREQVLTESRRHAATLTSLAQAGMLFSDSLDPPQVLETAKDVLIPSLADEIRIRVTDPRAGRSEFTAGQPTAGEDELDRALGDCLDQDDGTGVTAPGTVLSVPLVSHGRTLGALAIARRGREYREEDRSYLDSLAGRLALAYDNAARFRNERRLALTLQRALLPQHLPQVPGLRTASYYRASTTGTEIGGDWYDVIALPDGAMGLAIGDVMGHDVAAATVMGRLRPALRGFALDGASPGSLLAKLDAYLRSLDVEHFATCLYAVYEPGTRRLRYASSGHLPPLVVAGEATGFLETRPGAPLGLAQGAPEDHETRLPAGAGLLLFTDGLVENSRLSLDNGLAALRTACADLPESARHDPQRIIDRAMELLGAPGHVDDDTALLAASAGS